MTYIFQVCLGRFIAILLASEAWRRRHFPHVFFGDRDKTSTKSIRSLPDTAQAHAISTDEGEAPKRGSELPARWHGRY